MIRGPKGFEPLFNELKFFFVKQSTGTRVVWLPLAAILVAGNRTVFILVRLISSVQYVNPSTYHRVLFHLRWAAVGLAIIIIRFLLDRYLPTGPLRLCGDEAVDGHRGKYVCGKARHRHAVPDCSGTHRDEYSFTTDTEMPPKDDPRALWSTLEHRNAIPGTSQPTRLGDDSWMVADDPAE